MTKWIDEFRIDGLRLDAADVMDHDFLRALAALCRSCKHDFWLVGEVVHGDYRTWICEGMLDSVTNYEAYKGLYSSHNDRNYFEIAYSFNRQFGPNGLYRGLPLYNFADNHDVNRIASMLKKPAHLYPLYILLFTMPGIPSVYYGSEWGIEGIKQDRSDAQLRPALGINEPPKRTQHPDLIDTIRRLVRIRREVPALISGTYEQVHVGHEQFAFLRRCEEGCALVAVNAAAHPVTLKLSVPYPNAVLYDSLNGNTPVRIERGNFVCMLHPHWGTIFRT